MSKLPSYWTVYKATCPNGIPYVGACHDFSKRKYNHRLSAEEGVERKFSKAIRKHGWNNLQWEILATPNSREEALDLEVEMIEKYDSYRNGYNMTKGGLGSTGCKATEKQRTATQRPEVREKLRQANTGKTATIAAKEKMSRSMGGKAVYVWDATNRNFIGEYVAKSTCSKELNVDRWNMGKCLKGDCEVAGGYFFSYTNECPDYPLRSEDAHKRVIAYDKESNSKIGIWDTAKLCADSLGIDNSNVYRCLKGKRKSASGFIFKYE